VANEARPLRTVTFSPGNDEARARAIADAGSDALVLDLEDGTPPHEKARARELARKLIEELAPRGIAMIVRVNGLASGLTGSDLERVVCPALHGVFLPKVTGPNDVVGVSALLDHFEHRAGLPAGHTLVTPIMETALAIKHAFDIGSASPRVAYMGGAIAKDGDQARSIGYEWTPEGRETLYIRSRMIIEARAAGVPYPLGGMWTAVEDLEGLRRFSLETRQIGYNGMLVAHYPAHVAIVNEVFTPTPRDIAHDRSVIEIVTAGEARGASMQEKDGFVIDPAMVKRAQDRLALARRLGVLRD